MNFLANPIKWPPSYHLSLPSLLKISFKNMSRSVYLFIYSCQSYYWHRSSMKSGSVCCCISSDLNNAWHWINICWMNELPSSRSTPSHVSKVMYLAMRLKPEVPGQYGEMSERRGKPSKADARDRAKMGTGTMRIKGLWGNPAHPSRQSILDSCRLQWTLELME